MNSFRKIPEQYDFSESSSEVAKNDKLEMFKKRKGELLAAATKARDLARENRTQYRNFYVGSAMLCTDGSIYFGGNKKKAQNLPKSCAEREAIDQMLDINPHSKILAIVVISEESDTDPSMLHSHETTLKPCQSCKNMLATNPAVSRDTMLLTVNDSLKGDRLEELYTIGDFIPEKE